MGKKCIRYFESAWRNVRRRKRARAAGILLFLSLLFYVGGECAVQSVCERLEQMDKGLLARSIIIDDDREHTVMKQIQEEYSSSDEVGYIYPFVYAQSGSIGEVRDLPQMEGAGCDIWAYHPGLAEYMVSGKKEQLEKDEILIPQYVYNVGELAKNEYIRGDALVGKEIVIHLVNDFNGNIKYYHFRVAGTYDNVELGMEKDLYVESSVAEDMMEFMMEDINSEEQMEALAQEMEGEEGENIIICETPISYYTAVCLKDRSKVADFISKYGGIRQQEVDDAFLDYFVYLGFIADVLAVFLFLAAVIQLLLATIHEAQERKHEVALMKSMGYSDRSILFIAGMEYLLHAVRAFGLACIVSAAGIIYGNYAIQHWLDVALHCYHLTIEGRQVIQALLLSMILPVCAVIVTYSKTRNIQMATALKEKE